MINIDNFVFIDTETTGLNFSYHEILELSYAIGDGDIITLYPSDNEGIFETADPKAIEVNKYFERFGGNDYGRWYEVPSSFEDFPGVEKTNIGLEVFLALPVSDFMEWDVFFNVIEGKTLVGANPGFDRAFLEALRRRPLKANHRLFDIQAFAAGLFFFDPNKRMIYTSQQERFDAYTKFPSLRDLCDMYSIYPGDHTSAGDVLATREVWKRLVDIA